MPNCTLGVEVWSVNNGGLIGCPGTAGEEAPGAGADSFSRPRQVSGVQVHQQGSLQPISKPFCYSSTLHMPLLLPIVKSVDVFLLAPNPIYSLLEAIVIDSPRSLFPDRHGAWGGFPGRHRENCQ